MLAVGDAISKIKHFNGNTRRNPIAVASKWQPGEKPKTLIPFSSFLFFKELNIYKIVSFPDFTFH